MADPKIEAVGEFIVEKLLSESGMSYVYLAHLAAQPALKVAIKLHLETNTPGNTFQDLLRKEADLLVKLRHPGVVRIYPIPIPSGRVVHSARAVSMNNPHWYFIMEYLPGGDMGKYVKTVSKFPIPWIIEFFYQLLVTVQFLHQMDYGHCDLKPQNILLREAPKADFMVQPVLTDFGTVHKLSDRISRPARSIRYSPPEIILAHARKDMKPAEFPLYPAKIDTWSLGAILFEMITGRPLFNQRKEDEITTSILRGELDTIRDLRPEAHESLDKLLRVMLNRAPDDRPDIDQVIEAIEERISSVRPPRLPIEDGKRRR